MTSFRHLADWLGNHQLLYTFILFLLAAVISIYSQDVRTFIHSWPRSKVREFNRKRIAERLQLLKQINGSAYHLLFYFAIQFIQMVYEWLLLAVIFTILSAALGLGKANPLATLLALFAGASVGRVNTVREVLKQLGKYEQSVSALENQQWPY